MASAKVVHSISLGSDISDSQHGDVVPTTAGTRGSGCVHALAIRWQELWRRPYATWHPTFFQIRPIAALLALCIAVGCVFASLAILMISDAQAVASWPIQPTVYLAIVTAIANAALALAWLEAGPVFWWYNASRGMSVQALERHWQVSRGVAQAVVHSRHLSLLNIACIAAACVVIDGPLLQRASSVVRATQTTDTTLEIVLPPELPLGFTGTLYRDILTQTMASKTFLRDHLTKAPMHLNITPACKEKCRATVQGPGVAKSSCLSKKWPITYDMLHSGNASWGPWKYYTADEFGIPEAYLPLFYVRVTPNYEQPTGEAATLTTGIASWSDWEGEFVETTCFLLPSINAYDIEIEGNLVHLPHEPNQGRVISLANNTQPIKSSRAWFNDHQKDTIDAITVAVNLLTSANATADFGLNSVSWLFNPFSYNAAAFTYQMVSPNGKNMHFEDPTSDIIFTFNQLMFRGATMVAPSGPTPLPIHRSDLDPGVSVAQTVAALHIVTQNVFRSELKWFVGAAILELVTVLLILPLFWGWWTLGCNLSMSPFNIALAFDSPIVKDVNSASGSKGVAEEIGNKQLKFGVVYSPDRISVTGDPGLEEGKTSGRLGIDESHIVAKPRKGTIFRE